MDKATFRYLEKILRDYPLTEKYIKNREQELIYKFQEMKDENVGGGRAINKKNDIVERMAIDLATDRRLYNIQRNYEAVEECLKWSKNDVRKVIKAIYFLPNNKSLEGIASELHTSKSAVIRKRNKFMDNLADKIGI